MKNIEEIYDALCEEYTERTELVLSSTGDMSIRLHAFAAELHSLWVQADWVNKQSFPQTASGRLLELHAELRGLTRGNPTRAEGEIEFYITGAISTALSVPAGTVCLTDDATEFVTTESGTIPAGQLRCTVHAEARQPGVSGNVQAGVIFNMAQVPMGIRGCINRKAFKGGIDTESDAALRERVVSSYRRLPNGANIAFYETQALTIDGISKATVVPRARGIGTVDVVVASHSGIPQEELVAQVAEMLESQREICVDVRVAAPTPVQVAVRVGLEIMEGYDSAHVCAAVREALEAHFNGGRLGESVYLSRLGSVIFTVGGVANYSFSSPAGDIAIAPSELPMLSSCTVTEIGG